MKKFDFKSSIKDLQNQLVANSIRTTSNLELLKSEEAIQSVIKSYMDRFSVVEGRLTSAVKLVVESKDLIKKEQFNNLFESVFIDLSVLYKDLEIVDSVLTLNLQRNKNYFQILKKRIKDLWNRLTLSRMNIYDNNPGSESYYESFFTSINAKSQQNTLIDKKFGFLTLSPISRNVYNESFIVKNVTCTTHPVDNEDGGVDHTTNYLNTFEYNYQVGKPRDMLENGLWKVEVLCDDVPNMYVQVTDYGSGVYKNFRGIVSLIDIEYVYPVEVNRIDFDIFGDTSIRVDSIFYKERSDDSWKQLNYVPDDTLSYTTESSLEQPVSGEGVDVLSFYNVEKIKVLFLRIVVNQENYSFLDSLGGKEITVEEQINTDLSERRYEVLKFGSSLDDMLSTPVNDENTSLYSQLIGIIESTKNIELILEKIYRLLTPDLKVKTVDFNKMVKFESGMWSIEPMLEKYTSLVGSFDSTDYFLRDRSLIAASIKTAQTAPRYTTCNWYINVNGKDIPIVENNDFLRKEPINIIDMSVYGVFTDWPGVFVLLDLPVDPSLIDYITLFENGTEVANNDLTIAYMNSRILYFHNITDPFKFDYVIRYPIARHKTVRVYVPKSSSSIIPRLEVSMVSLRRDVLANLLGDLTYDGVALDQNYSVEATYITYDEAVWWFRTFNTCVFIDQSFKILLEAEGNNSNILNDTYGSIISAGPTKLVRSLADVEEFINGDTTVSFELNEENICPIGLFRELK